MYTIEQAERIGTAVATAAKTYGQASGLAAWSAKSGTFAPLEAAIKKGGAIKDKVARKKALAIWTTTLKRVGKGGEKPTETEPSYLAFKVDGPLVSVYWKTPEPQAAGEGEGEGEAEGAADVVGISLEQALERIRQAYANQSEAETVVNELRLMGLL